MKESEFIELLNLYLDHEISEPDAIRLEAEVQHNPARRRVYQQYCRMQKACKAIAADFHVDTAPAHEKKVIAFDPLAAAVAQRKRSNNFYTVGAIAAAAACVAIVFVGRSRQEANEVAAPQSEAIAQTVAAPAPAATPVAPRGGIVSVAGVVSRERSQATLVTDPLLLTAHHRQTEAVLTAAVQDANNQLNWITSLQLTPLQQRVQAEELKFDLQPATLRPEPRALGGNRAPKEAKVEMTAFQITK